MKIKLGRRLEQQSEAFSERWVEAVARADIQYAGIVSEDILGEGMEAYQSLSRILDRPSYEIGPKKRINSLGKRIGERRAMTGVALEAVLEVFITFRHEFWRLIESEELSVEEILEVRRRVDLYLDQLIASVAYAYTSTKDKAMVGLIERLLQ